MKLWVWEVESVWHTKMESIWKENRFHGKDLPGEIKRTVFDIKKQDLSYKAHVNSE